MSVPRTAAVVGLGLLGGSFARELAARGTRVLAHDRDPTTLAAALDSGVVSASLTPGGPGLAEADLLVLAVPVTAAAAALAEWLPGLHPDAVVTDLGSTKASIVRAAAGLGIAGRFVGSHPLAGDHRSGWAASRSGLFSGALVYLTPTPHTGRAALATVAALWTELGARTEQIQAEEHDRRLAWTSHLPQSAATALALELARAGRSRSDLGPGGRDTTRLAGSSPEMWTAVCLDNADFLEEALAGLGARLAELRAAVTERDALRIESFFAAGREWAREE